MGKKIQYPKPPILLTLPVAISITTQPTDHTSAARPWPSLDWKISGAM